MDSAQNEFVCTIGFMIQAPRKYLYLFVYYALHFIHPVYFVHSPKFFHLNTYT